MRAVDGDAKNSVCDLNYNSRAQLRNQRDHRTCNLAEWPREANQKYTVICLRNELADMVVNIAQSRWSHVIVITALISS